MLLMCVVGVFCCCMLLMYDIDVFVDVCGWCVVLLYVVVVCC